jgi:lysozyme family protein
MKTVDDLIGDVLRREGRYVDHPADRGGPTNFGITQATLSRYVGYAVTAQEVKDLDVDVARDIYENDYYYGPGIQKLPEPVQPFLFDCAVNHGPRRAIKFAQNVVNQAGYPTPLDVDGAVGPNTRKGVQWAQDNMGPLFLKALFEERKNFYRLIVQNDPSQQVFLRGWMNRVKEFEDEFANEHGEEVA